MEKLTQFKKNAANHRLKVIFVIGVTSIITIILFRPSNIQVSPIVFENNITPNVRNTDKVVMPVGNQNNEQLKRDPFMPPAIRKDNFETQKENSVTTIFNQETVTDANQALFLKVKERIKLTGIINTDNCHIAVIQSDRKSKAYKLNEFIGIYQLIAIQDDCIILKNRNSQLSIPLEPAREKGGTK